MAELELGGGASSREGDPSIVSLDDRFRASHGRVYLTGVQALVRLILDQARRDRRAGRRIGNFVTGYPGSPLGNFDLALAGVRSMLDELGIIHRPAQNEEIAASSIWGTQMLDTYPSRFEGVNAFWYGKGPGLDRAGDAIHLGNFAGTAKNGAVVVLSGEDHEAKSSSAPFQQDWAFVHHGIPILYPSSVGEFLSLGQHAVEMSRYAGVWVALKLVGQLCDGGEVVEIDDSRPPAVLPTLEIEGVEFRKRTDFTFFPGLNIETERELYEERHRAALEYGRANSLDRIEIEGPNDHIGLVAAGKSYADLRQALADLGLDDDRLRESGVRVLKIGMIYPIDHRIIQRFSRGLRRIIVIEEKRSFLETSIKEALNTHPVAVHGKSDADGRPWFPLHGGLDADAIAERLAPVLLEARGGGPALPERIAELREIRMRGHPALPRRTPNYCSGCPHNLSTRLLEGQRAWGSPGCHVIASVIRDDPRRIEAATQYGGEGLPWIGLAPFVDRPHMTQNVGDGSLFHSSYLNIRYAVATGANITFKILFNGAIANTGAQSPVGGKSVSDLIRLLALEGVARIALVTKDPRPYRRAGLPSCASVHSTSEYEPVLRQLEAIRGVTVFVYDEMCANERRRRQRRSTLPPPRMHVFINADVCENCGHCGALTNCMSLQKVDTAWGPKTQVHQSSCNQDSSCLAGDCPSFVTVHTSPGTTPRKPRPLSLPADVAPEPSARPRLDRPFHIFLPGVGGTGVITTNALLCWAARLEGKGVLSYDLTGTAQKWGPVVSSVILFATEGTVHANKVGAGKADLYLALDAVAASDAANLARCAPSRTVAVLNTGVLPTGEMIRDVNHRLPIEAQLEEIERWTDRDRNVRLDAHQAAQSLFGDHLAANVLSLGAAYQAGLLPLGAGAIEAAIRLNGASVEQNLQAFRYGRLLVHDAERARAVIDPRPPSRAEAVRAEIARSGSPGSRWVVAFDRLLGRCDGLAPSVRQTVAARVAELVDYQDVSYASEYVDAILRVASRANASAGHFADEITRAFATHLHSLMAYKDEYEVARLHLKPSFRRSIEDAFAGPVRIAFNLHPPLLRRLGLRRKVELRVGAISLLRLLRSMRRLRGTRWDPFGRHPVRRTERELIGWYRETMDEALRGLNPENAGIVVEIARLPDLIRGYEDIKLANVARAKTRSRELARTLDERLGSRARSA